MMEFLQGAKGVYLWRGKAGTGIVATMDSEICTGQIIMEAGHGLAGVFQIALPPAGCHLCRCLLPVSGVGPDGAINRRLVKSCVFRCYFVSVGVGG